MAKIYKVDPLKRGFFSGSLNPKKLEERLNQASKEGWTFDKSIHETKGKILKREAHFLVFTKEA